MSERKILLVEDEKDIREMLKKVLEIYGRYTVIMAEDGKEAIKQANITKPDLILMDIKMPEMDGLEALKILKETSTTVAIPVIMVTACSEDLCRAEAGRLYDEDYITKPVKIDDLIARIEKVLIRRTSG